MERRRLFLRRPPLVGVALLVLVAATGCGGSGPVGRTPAASVNAVDISARQVFDLVEAQQRFLDLRRPGTEKQRADAQKKGQQVMSAADLTAEFDKQISRFDGSGADSLSTAGAADILTSLISDEIFREALRSVGGRVTLEQRSKARTDVEGQIRELKVKVADVPAALVDQVVEQSAIRTALEATAPPEVRNRPALTDEDYTKQLRQIYDSKVGDFSQLCLNIILIKDEAAGRAARQRVEAGEAFADVAAQVSSEGRTAAVDGAGGCVAVADVAGVLGDGAKTAKAGDLLGPGKVADGSILLVQIDRVNVPTFDQIRPQLEQSNPNSSEADAEKALQEYVATTFAKAAARARITVDPRYGTWDPETRAVVPPVDPAAAALAPTAPSTGPPDRAGTAPSSGP